MSIDFPHPTPDNIGGCKAFSFVDIDKVISAPESIYDPHQADVTLLPGEEFSHGYASKNSLEYSVILKENDAGLYFLIEITGFYPKLSKEAFTLFSEMLHGRYIVIITDNNGLPKSLGNLDAPLEFSFETSSGKNPSARNGFIFSFKGKLIP